MADSSRNGAVAGVFWKFSETFITNDQINNTAASFNLILLKNMEQFICLHKCCTICFPQFDKPLI